MRLNHDVVSCGQATAWVAQGASHTLALIAVSLLPFILGMLDWSLIWTPIILYVGLVLVTVIVGALFGKRGKEASGQ